MSIAKQFTFFVRNDTTKEIASFTGQGITIEEAHKDAIATINTPWNPSQTGIVNSQTNVVLPLNVTLADGRKVARLKKEFEGEEEYSG